MAIALLSLACAGESTAGTLEDGLAAFENYDFDSAARLLEPLAGVGDPVAETKMGMMSAYGWGMAQDYPAAAKWFTPAAWQAVHGAAATVSDEISVERGRIVSIVAGCHGCHTAGYTESNGEIDPDLAMKGTSIGWQGPWGTTYPLNLRLTVKPITEDGFVLYLRSFQALPPMPWYSLRQMPEADMRSLYRYIKSLGDPGEQVPPALAAGEQPRTPYIVLAPPQSPPACTRDLDCGVGQLCDVGKVRVCVSK
jgi:mono/diheme cytochrome c family protein